jgi:hypothetical protein
MYISLHK